MKRHVNVTLHGEFIYKTTVEVDDGDDWTIDAYNAACEALPSSDKLELTVMDDECEEVET